MVVGEALVDFVVGPDCTRTAHPGGSPLNVAVDLGRLGLETAPATRFGDGSFDTIIQAHLRDAGVAPAPQDRPSDAPRAPLRHRAT